MLELQFGWTALHKAAYEGEKDVAALLLDRGAAVDAKEQVSGIPCVCTWAGWVHVQRGVMGSVV